ncbi:MAG: PP2C family protein-serine/threonine phosphatase [Candidatus Uhrbacteria bacterium]|nr:PP2C family protein-serine/threonine phosphatase [Candidatus Uhrbacteria bacterium]
MAIFHSCSFIGIRSEQQDRFVVLENAIMSGDLLVILCDGHNVDGAWCAEQACNLLASGISQRNPFVQEDIVQLFCEVDEFICKDKKIKGGTTATMLYIMPERAMVANVGDSPALLTGIRDRYTFLHTDHSMENPSELKRMEDLGYTVSRSYFQQPNRKAPKGLNISRALGDAHMKPGVIATPDVAIIEGRLRGAALVIASDGILLCRTQLMGCLAGRSTFARRALVSEGIIGAACLHDNSTAVMVDLKGYYARQ